MWHRELGKIRVEIQLLHTGYTAYNCISALRNHVVVGVVCLLVSE